MNCHLHPWHRASAHLPVHWAPSCAARTSPCLYYGYFSSSASCTGPTTTLVGALWNNTLTLALIPIYRSRWPLFAFALVVETIARHARFLFVHSIHLNAVFYFGQFVQTFCFAISIFICLVVWDNTVRCCTGYSLPFDPFHYISGGYENRFRLRFFVWQLVANKYMLDEWKRRQIPMHTSKSFTFEWSHAILAAWCVCAHGHRI